MTAPGKSRFKALIFTKDALGTISMYAVALILFFSISFIPKKSLSEFIIGNFLICKSSYFDTAELFTDKNGRIYGILNGYTMSIGKNKEEPVVPDIPTPAPEAIIEAPKISESKSSSVAEIKNQSGKAVDTKALLKEPLLINTPKVLIIHTHTTESYYNEDRSIDETKNMLAVGSIIADELKKGGIEVIHDKTVHDYPSYSASYERSAATTAKNLKNNEGINIVLDVHRDAVTTQDGSKLSLCTEINGEKTAQLMFVIGTDAQLQHPDWQENLKLALTLQNKANEMYKELMRPINLRAQRFNQQLSKGSIILEIGTNGNTLEEAKRGAKLFSDVLLEVLSNYK